MRPSVHSVRSAMPEGSILRRQILAGVNEAAKKNSAELTRQEKGLKDYENRCRDIYGLTQTSGWKILEGWLADIANPYSARTDDGFDQQKLRDAKVAMDILLRVSAMSAHIEQIDLKTKQ